MTGVGEVIATSIREANSSGVKSFGVCIVIGELTIRMWPLSDGPGHREIYEPIPDRKRGLSVVLRISAALCFQTEEVRFVHLGMTTWFCQPPDADGRLPGAACLRLLQRTIDHAAVKRAGIPSRTRIAAGRSHLPALRRLRPRTDAVQRGGVV
jgi:hypothetical protein